MSIFVVHFCHTRKSPYLQELRPPRHKTASVKSISLSHKTIQNKVRYSWERTDDRVNLLGGGGGRRINRRAQPPYTMHTRFLVPYCRLLYRSGTRRASARCPMGPAARSERAYMRIIFKEKPLPTRYERKKSHVYKRGSAYILDRVR